MFIQLDAFEKIICKMAAILPRPQCVYITANTAGELARLGFVK